MSEEIEGYENNLELELFKEYRDVIGLFKFVVETERRFYLCNHVDVQARPVGGDVFFELTLTDAWVWDIYRCRGALQAGARHSLAQRRPQDKRREPFIHRPLRQPLPVHRGRFSCCVARWPGRTVVVEVSSHGMLNTTRSSDSRCSRGTHGPPDD